MDRVEIFQNKTTISIPRESFMQNIVYNDRLKKNDYRVLALLLTVLNGWNYDARQNSKIQDPYNFKVIDIEQVAETLDMKKKEVKESINRLLDEYIIEKGDGTSVTNGYRFTF